MHAVSEACCATLAVCIVLHMHVLIADSDKPLVQFGLPALWAVSKGTLQLAESLCAKQQAIGT